MKLLDKYVAKNFLIGYVISFGVLIGLRIVIDMFVNIDEFAQYSDLGILVVIKNIITYYALNTTLYFRDFAGMITVFAAAFSVGRLVRSGELVTVMASGVSLKRVIVPIVVIAIVLSAVLYIDQEFIIPPLGPELVRDRGALAGEETYDVDFIADTNGSLICAAKFDYADKTLVYPTIITRQRKGNTMLWNVTGRISAEKAVYNQQAKRWDLVDGRFTEKSVAKSPEVVDYFVSDIKPEDIPLQQRSQFKTLLSSSQLSRLISSGSKDMAQLLSQKHFRITDILINMIMLLISLPILVCRDPRTMKSAIGMSFSITTLCFLTTFVCKMMATEYVFARLAPGFWAWLPVFIFAPIAFIELDSMKT